MTPKLYLAGPITGESWNGATSWRDYVAETLFDIGIECLSPLRGKNTYLVNEQVLDMEYRHPLSTAKGITARDRNDVMTCDAILVNLLGAQRVSIGTVLEIAWADAFRKPIILASDPGGVHDHSMINEIAGFILDDLDEAIDIAIAVLLP